MYLNLWHLVWLIPAIFIIGFCFCSWCASNKLTFDITNEEDQKQACKRAIAVLIERGESLKFMIDDKPYVLTIQAVEDETLDNN